MRVLTEAGSVPAVVARGATGDAVVAQQPITCHSAPQADAADARLEVSRAALTVRAAPCGEESTVNTLASQREKKCSSHPFKNSEFTKFKSQKWSRSKGWSSSKPKHREPSREAIEASLVSLV